MRIDLRLCWMVWLALVLAGVAMAQSIDPERVAAVKAAMVFNFVKYTQWPESAFENHDSPIVMTIVGRSEMDDHVSRSVEGKRIDERAIEVRRIDYPRPRSGEFAPHPDDIVEFQRRLTISHVVFFATPERNRIRSTLDALRGKNVLTISDIPAFAENGGMLGLAVRENRVAFDANPGEIQKTKLNVSSKVLKLARIVSTREE